MKETPANWFVLYKCLKIKQYLEGSATRKGKNLVFLGVNSKQWVEFCCMFMFWKLAIPEKDLQQTTRTHVVVLEYKTAVLDLNDKEITTVLRR